MPELRKDEKYRDRHRRSFLISFGLYVLLIGSCALAILFLGSSHINLVFIFLAAFLVAGFRLIRAFNSHNDRPECGTRLPALKKDPSTRREHRFLCYRCDILWTTGVYDDES